MTKVLSSLSPQIIGSLVRFDNLKAEGRTRCFECTFDNIAECEIRINGTFLGLIKKCIKSAVELHATTPDYLSINHQFFFEHGTTPWRYCESLSLNLSYEPLPKDITADLRLKSHNTSELENFSYS